MPYGGAERFMFLFEFYGDRKQYAEWLLGNTPDEADFHLHTLKALKVAMAEELSPLQREYIEKFFFQGMDMGSIGEEAGVGSLRRQQDGQPWIGQAVSCPPVRKPSLPDLPAEC